MIFKKKSSSTEIPCTLFALSVKFQALCDLPMSPDCFTTISHPLSPITLLYFSQLCLLPILNCVVHFLISGHFVTFCFDELPPAFHMAGSTPSCRSPYKSPVSLKGVFSILSFTLIPSGNLNQILNYFVYFLVCLLSFRIGRDLLFTTISSEGQTSA